MMNVAVVTGGNKGIGLEVSRLLAARGFEVVVVARDFSRAGELPAGARPIEFDLTEVEKIPGLMERVGGLDVLVNNAGVMNSLPFDAYPLETGRRLMRLNLEAPIALMTAAAPLMAGRGGGRIVNLASLAGQTGHPDVWYGASKAGLANATKSFAKLLGPKGIMVNCVAPGPAVTEMLAAIPEQRKQAVLRNTATGRFCEPGEVARTVAWLATEAPVYINGACIDINDGAYLR